MEYYKKPIKIEAIQYTGGNAEEIKELSHEDIIVYPNFLEVITPEGKMRATKGDYIIKGIAGEVYPCKEEIFLKTYTKQPENVEAGIEEVIDTFMMQHMCDSVLVIASRHSNDTEKSSTMVYNKGNAYASLGAAASWLKGQGI